MIKQFNNLTPLEYDMLIKAPILISVLVSCSEKQVNKTQKNDAIKLAHLRTFTAPPELQQYYSEVDRIFKKEFEASLKNYYPFDEEKLATLIDSLQTTKQVIKKLPADYAKVLTRSLESYTTHV